MNSFFGAVGIYEYSCGGLATLCQSKLDIMNTKHIRYLNLQIQQLKLLYFKYKRTNLLERNGLIELLQCSGSMENITLDVLELLEIKENANFGQFLSLIPFLLENYSAIMQKVL